MVNVSVFPLPEQACSVQDLPRLREQLGAAEGLERLWARWQRQGRAQAGEVLPETGGHSHEG